MSGGVDSSMTVLLLQRAGYEVIGLTMQLWPRGTDPGPFRNHYGCYSPSEPSKLEKIHHVAKRLGIPLHLIPLSAEFKAGVLDYFCEAYKHGQTPNPCVNCNLKIKFGSLIAKAHQLGLEFDYFATGHYARIIRNEKSGRFVLYRGCDSSKDQSYFLSALTQSQLANTLFPLGEWQKEKVKELARENDFADLAGQDESQDFITSQNLGSLFDQKDLRPGPIIDTAGMILGHHRGIVYYTIGQRKGLGISGTIEPLYVVHIDAANNTVIVGRQEELFKNTLNAKDINWITAQTYSSPIRVQAKIRQQHTAAEATVTPSSPTTAEVVFDKPQMSITPGQRVVFYEGDAVVGGGTIQ